jgi:hypothetical protein
VKAPPLLVHRAVVRPAEGDQVVRVGIAAVRCARDNAVIRYVFVGCEHGAGTGEAGGATTAPGAGPGPSPGHGFQVVCCRCGKVVYNAVVRSGEDGDGFIPADGQSGGDDLIRDHARRCTRELTDFERFAMREGIPVDGGGLYDPASGAWLGRDPAVGEVPADV